jgi:hypothetical protein
MDEVQLLAPFAAENLDKYRKTFLTISQILWQTVLQGNFFAPKTDAQSL